MSPFTFFRQLYSLDTLDTRLTTSATTPLDVAQKERDTANHKGQNGKIENDVSVRAQPSKWNTPEFYFYALVFILVVPQMFKSVIDASKESHPTYKQYEDLLSQGWIFGRKVDNSDAQYAGFRDNIPYLALLLLLHPILRRFYQQLYPINAKESMMNGQPSKLDKQHPNEAESRMRQRTLFDLYFGLVFLTALHGISALKVLLILYMNFCIARRLPKSYIPTMTWVLNISVLFANELQHGYPLGDVVAYFSPSSKLRISWATTLDSYGGLMPRWEVLFKMTVLRLISYNFDYYWSLNRRATSPIEKKQLDPTSLSERDRIAIPASASAFTWETYLAYALYSPLYLAGPILTFNDYIAQNRYPSPSLNSYRILLYGIRFVVCLLIMEFLLHYAYTVAISKSSPDWSSYTPFQVAMLGFFNLHIIWLKLLIPWRLFRLWALIDDIDPPENMVRCMSNNYAAASFWRGWHRSFNRWTVRYIYVPLGGGTAKGGSKLRAVLNVLAVFTFVALWHDINLRLLAWGWLITLFVIPEILATVAFPARKWQDHPNTYRVICGVGAVVNILMMMTANLVGFAVGLDGLKGLVMGIVGTWHGVVFFITACATLFVGVQVMFEIRESEKRKGINLKF